MKPAGSRRKTIHVAVGVLFRDDGAVLLADRPVGKAYAGYWEFPGGKIEAGETVETALARELHEELGIDIARSVPWVAFEFDYPHAYVRLHFRRVVHWSGAPHAREGQRLGFFLPSEALPEPLLPAAMPAIRWLTLPPIYAISNIAAGGVEPFMCALGASLQRGLRLLAVREPAMNVAQLAALAPRIIAQVHASRARVLVSSRHDRSLWSLFDGVHLTSEDLLRAERRPVARLVAASVHDRNQLAHAHRLGCDFAVLGPVRATASHPAAATLDWSGFMQIAEEAAIPVYAIGGLTPVDLPDAQRAGAHGVALLRAAWTAR